MKKSLRDLIMLFAALALIFIDQFTKVLVTNNLTGGKEIIVWDGVFKIVSHRNTGAVWGIMSDSTTLLSIITAVILILIVFVYFRCDWEYKKLRVLKVICMFVTAGAIGNLIDRIRLKYVVDFLYFELIDFPVFNIADCYITVSMFLLVILFIFYFKDEDLEKLWPKKSK